MYLWWSLCILLNTEIKINGQKLETVESFKYFVRSGFSAEGDLLPDKRRRGVGCGEGMARKLKMIKS